MTVPSNVSDRSKAQLPIKLIAPLAIIVVLALVAWIILKNPSQAKMHNNFTPPQMSVEVSTVELTDYTVKLTSYGLVRPRTESSLVAQVSGVVTEVSDRFQEGAFFETGDLILKIEGRDYKSAVVIAKADYAQAKYQLSEEEARGIQAQTNWRRMDHATTSANRSTSAASDLVLRKPQMLAAQAKVASAKARLDKAKLDLTRTEIKAPYAGRVLKKNVDRGQYISANTKIGDIYAVDYLEVRMPLSSRQREFVFIPEQYRYQKSVTADKTKKVTEVILKTSVGRKVYSWAARLTRAEGALDAVSRQLNVIAQVENPYTQRADGAPPLKIGQFVEATIIGDTLSGVFVLPRGAIKEDKYVAIVETKGDQATLVRKNIEFIWSDDDNVIVALATGSLQVGDQLIISPLGDAVDGTLVKVRLPK